MRDSHGKITLPRFYDQVRTLSSQEREELAKDAYSDADFCRVAGIKRTYGENGYTTLERLGARPTLEINGLLSGFTSEGAKTVLPAKAMAKISMRLVPNQDPLTIEKSFIEYMNSNAPPTVTWEVKRHTGSEAALIDRNSLGMCAASTALEKTFKTKPIYRLEGGTLPLVNLVKKTLGVDAVMLGFSLPDDAYHAPNERYYLPNYYRGIETYIHFFDQVSR